MGNKLCTCSSEDPGRDKSNLDLQVPVEQKINPDDAEELEAKSKAIPCLPLDKTGVGLQSLKSVKIINIYRTHLLTAERSNGMTLILLNIVMQMRVTKENLRQTALQTLAFPKMHSNLI